MILADPTWIGTVGFPAFQGYHTDGPCAPFATAGFNVLATPWNGGDELPFFTIPFTNNTGSCITFEVLDDAFQQDSTILWYIYLNGTERNNGYIPGKESVCGSPTSVAVTLRDILEGPWVPMDGLMSDAPRQEGYLPLSHPYGGAPWNHAGTEAMLPGVLATTGNDAIVDRVLVELRSAMSPSTVIARQAALIQRDGDIVDTCGTSNLSYTGAAVDNYYISIRHRNHLGIMTASPTAVSSSTPAIDLSDPLVATCGTQARKPIGGIAALWTGNVFADDRLKYTGLDNDRDPILANIGGTVPTAVRIEQLP